MSQSRFRSVFEQKLVVSLDEKIRVVVENLSIGFMFVPNVMPTENYMGLYMPSKKFNGAMALTNHRIIASWEETSECVRTLHIPSINNITERPLRSDKPSWPYQAILMLSGGLVLITQTQKPNEEQAKQMSSLLNEAAIRFGANRDDTGSLAAIISYEVEKARQQSSRDDDYQKKKEE